MAEMWVFCTVASLDLLVDSLLAVEKAQKLVAAEVERMVYETVVVMVA